ncbi:HlyD family secretion protein [Methylotenera sp.]|uniref:HlyD family secretion protein n=1 Tax=Methylotenera sp. TaxID=2051956 RepID=UPI00273537ED|nr:HlyD family efflux transporter periplasmic adaptor subunit [Methylotenera sp.]MDP3210870.1 HlyD family efflux transporter periplasmic adaptor subunit [Methylotenera sp.]MDP3778197.1 HlyD family efflux transporter periplasmic adaptor subunit [Methylotenera sp.]
MSADNKVFNDALVATETPEFVVRYVRNLSILFFVLPIIAMFLPWQQNVTAIGKVTAFSPSERVQTIDAPVSGLISKWYVQEGSVVKEGDVLLEVSDIDPMFKDRLEAQRNNLQTKLNAKQDELKSYQVQQQNLMSSRDAKISAAQFKLDVANQKILSTTEAISAAKATADAAEFQSNRMQRLFVDGLVSKRDLEVAERDLIIAHRNLISAQAQHNSAKAEAQSAKAEILQIRADTQASLDSSSAVINKIKGELADSQNSLTSSEINLSRQNMQRIVAPRAGTIFRLPVNSQSQMISQGQPLLVILPETSARAVELWVDGRDAPLISTHTSVRLEFEGWPAIQVPGWAKVGIGTFSGKVSFVDPTDNGTGSFRVMVVPDEHYPDWPSARFLRQGISAKGWILLENVTIGYEIWRLLNGFPARIPELQTYPNEKVIYDKK